MAIRRCDHDTTPAAMEARDCARRARQPCSSRHFGAGSVRRMRRILSKGGTVKSAWPVRNADALSRGQQVQLAGVSSWKSEQKSGEHSLDGYPKAAPSKRRRLQAYSYQ